MNVFKRANNKNFLTDCAVFKENVRIYSLVSFVFSYFDFQRLINIAEKKKRNRGNEFRKRRLLKVLILIFLKTDTVLWKENESTDGFVIFFFLYFDKAQMQILKIAEKKTIRIFFKGLISIWFSNRLRTFRG